MADYVNAHWEHEDPQHTSNRTTGYDKEGVTGDHRSVYGYKGYGGTCVPNSYHIPGGSTIWVSLDMPNSGAYALASQTPTQALSKAWSRLFQLVHGDPAGLGVDLGQYREAIDTIGFRLKSIGQSLAFLRRGQPLNAFKALGAVALPGHRNIVIKSGDYLSRLWLEISYGWMPLAADIFAAMDLLSKPIKDRKVYGSGSQPLESYVSTSSHKTTLRGRVGARQYGTFVVTNPNQFLLSALGLSNPAAVAWDLVPWSFVVDWFTGVGTFVWSLSDLYGLEVRDAFHSWTATLNGLDEFKVDTVWVPVPNHFWYSKRTTGLASPLPYTPHFANFGSSIQRAANAASLLIQQLVKIPY